jgi:SAM-dependent methyltransferase
MNLHNFNIQAGERVLDIGCGARPFLLATHLADVSLNDNSGRFGMPIPAMNRPFFECSVEEMPFEDKFFDFVYCAHVLEHVADPAKACREIMRVGKRGYIECPRSWVEYIFESKDHKWLVDHEKNCLIFREKQDEERRDFLGLQYSIFDWIQYAGFRNHWNSESIKAVRNVEFYWEQQFNYMVIPKAKRKDAGFWSMKHLPQPSRRSWKTPQQLRQFLANELEQRSLASGSFTAN